jgi:hypothetical protein
MKKARMILDRHKEMKTEKQPWLNLYQLLGEYIMTRKQHFTSNVNPGEMQNDKIFDDTAPNAVHLMAASLIGALWPNGPKTFQISMPFGLEREVGDTEECKQYYQFVTKRMAEFMDNPKAGLVTSLEEYMLDQGAFGISGIGTFEQDDPEVPVIYKAVDAKNVTIDEGPNGFVDTVYIEKEFTLRQAVVEYGYDALSKARQEAYEKGDFKCKVKVLHAIQPRIERDPFGFGNADMPYASIHIDVENEKILRESGYTEMPVNVTRFWKAMGEKYGRSPGMNALPSILEANAIREATILAVEKNLDPPLIVLDDGSLGGGTINTSAGAINVFSVSGRLGSMGAKPVEPMLIVGELQSSYARLTELMEIIKNHFFQDRLMDLNNETRMTLGEANIRNNLRGQTLNTIYTRQITELFVPMIERTFNILLRKGFLGVIKGSVEEMMLLDEGIIPIYIPDAIADRMLKGQEVYKITFVSPAIRIMQTEELTGIQQTLQTAVEVAGVKPEILDNIDMDYIIKRVAELTGAPRETIVSAEVVQKFRKARAEQQQAMMEAEAQRQGSETARNMGQAVQHVSQAQGGQKGAA